MILLTHDKTGLLKFHEEHADYEKGDQIWTSDGKTRKPTLEVVKTHKCKSGINVWVKEI